MPPSEIATAAQVLLSSFNVDRESNTPETIQRSLFVARTLQRRAHELQSPEERKQQTELDRMIQNPSDKATLTAMTDQAFRSQAAARSADQLVHILDAQGVPRFFSPLERTLLHGFQSFGDYLPGVTIPMVKEKMRRETANVIIPAEPEVLGKHLGLRRQEGVRMNVNLLGEAILGEEEAGRRLAQYESTLQLDEIEVMSVKISTIYSQVSTLDRARTIDQLCQRLETLYRAAAKGRFERSDGSTVPKFIYLDMEEYRDLSITAEAFMKTLERPGLSSFEAGIALQAYVPDSFLWQKRLTEWAVKRVDDGGAPITIRIVKGANMEMERVEASVAGWPQAPFQHKSETDANYKRMVAYALMPEHIAAVRPGIASHNLFDLSYALVLACDHQSLGKIQFEMLEGMANHQRRALHELTQNLLLYAPACRKEDFIHAIGYLVRRLDENTGEENFLRHAFNITVDSEQWMTLEKGFVHAFDLIESLPQDPRRKQDRLAECTLDQVGGKPRDEPISDGVAERSFDNEPDTDFSLQQNAKWARKIISDWTGRHGDHALDMPLVVAGETVQGSRDSAVSRDPSRGGETVGRFSLADESDVNAAVQCAQDDPDHWRDRGSEERDAILMKVASELRRSRADLIGAAIADAGKTVMESDPEVSEAIDFVEFYARSADAFRSLPNVRVSPRGVVAVVSPWNFPIAIPCGGIAAALAAGNTVILKPASNAVLVAQRLCDCFYRAGVPRRVLQLLPCRGGSIGSKLVTHPGVDTVILTGGTSTAIEMLKEKPTLRLLAETGGKNATIVTAMADRDQAIKHVLRSAFGHAGQKCSATSLLLLEEEVFEDDTFRETLVDAANSLHVGSAWDLRTRIGPLISPPGDELDRGLKELEPGESWALRPRPIGDSECLYSPGIKWNVSRGSFTHTTEFFGPLLGVMKFRSLSEAIEIVNETGYGLTSGLESLDDREQKIWREGIRAGNLYLNRPTTGAIVLRQPFGGTGKSALGPGIKAGGPNYVAQLMDFQHLALDDSRESKSCTNPKLARLADGLARDASVSDEHNAAVITAFESYDKAAEEEFLKDHDHFRLIGQDNIRRYQPIQALCIRVDREDSWPEIVMRAAAANAVGCRSIISAEEGVHTAWIERLHRLTESWAGDIEFLCQSDQELCETIEWGGFTRIRYAAADRVPISIRKSVISRYVHIADAPVLPVGRIELLWYVREQSISSDYHRYGNLGIRASESRRQPE